MAARMNGGLTIRQTQWLTGSIMFVVCVLMLFFRPQESWYDDAYWADWAYRISQGGFITHVWGGDQPSYNPLYAWILAGWYKVAGFSYIKAQLPNLIFALLAFWVICFRWEEGKLFSNVTSVIGFGFLYWFADILFWIFANGRPNTLCILLGVLSVDSFSRSMDKGRWQDITSFALWAACMIATSIEGVVFTAVMMIVMTALNFKQYIQRWWIYIVYAVSSITGFLLELAYMTYHNCGLAFLRTQFGFSSTVNNLMQRLHISGWESSIGVVKQTGLTLTERLTQTSLDGIIINKEYIVGIILVVCLLVTTIVRRQWKELTRFERSVIVASVVMPWAYILAGRYVSYYTWAAYIPCIVALFILMQQQVKHIKIATPILVVLSLSYFIFSGNHQTFKTIDLHRVADQKNISDIEQLQIGNDEAIYIPYAWYYYLTERNNHLYFLGSGRYVKAMKRMVLTTEEEIQNWQKAFELEYIQDIGNRKVYRVLGDYGNNTLKDTEKQ
ncbi:MAG: glycosyltransferase family 39 protein [Paludibacteraceae bacterium]|nr:glycosyltransferase family 39 protein [Paludibacteraceae bacterium]